LNQWVRSQGENFINPHFWNEAKRDDVVPLGAEITIGFDGSVSGDCTTLVGMDVNTGLLKVLALWEPNPQDPNWSVDRLDVQMAVEKAFKDYDVKLLWADPSFYETEVADWASKWRNRVERIPPQSPVRMVPLAQQFITDLVSKEIGHDGSSALTRHALNAVATESGSFRKEKKNSPQKIDLLFASVLANGARHAYIAKPKIQRRNIIL
jgi:phage terminase large subunit-like protein